MTSTEFKDNVLVYSEKLYRIAFSILHDRESSEDVLQDVYVKLWNMREKLVDLKSVEAFAVTMTKNSSIDKVRSRKVKCDYPYLKDETSPPENRIDAKDKVEYVKQIIKSLPQKQQQVFNLRHFGDCSIEEISKVTELSEQNVRTILSRIRTLLKEKIESYG